MAKGTSALPMEAVHLSLGIAGIRGFSYRGVLSHLPDEPGTARDV